MVDDALAPTHSGASWRRRMSLAGIPGLSPLLACLALFLAWDLLARMIAIDSLPSPWTALREVPAILGDGEAVGDILASLRRMAIGLALALACAIPIGLMMGRSRAVAAFCNPLMMVIYPVPKAALMPIIMLWLGVGEAAKILVIFLGVSLPVIYHSYQGARAVEEKMLWSAAAMGMNARARLFRIALPSALPEIMVGVRTGLVLALITMVTSEMIARQNGVGNILFTSLDMAQYQTVYGMIIVIGLLGFVLDAGFQMLRGVLVGWAAPTQPLIVGST
jgi:NitT/TauT family transport system permease protein